MEKDLRTDPVTIINGFQFGRASANLMAYALDMARLGAVIDRNWFACRIHPDERTPCAMDLLAVSGPTLSRRNFDIFEQDIEYCIDNALTVFNAISEGFDVIMERLNHILSYQGSNPEQLDRQVLMYLCEDIDNEGNSVLNKRRLQSALMSDYEPRLYRCRSGDHTQYVWSSEVLHWLRLPTIERNNRIAIWTRNHGITQRRMQACISLHLRTIAPEQFS